MYKDFACEGSVDAAQKLFNIFLYFRIDDNKDLFVFDDTSGIWSKESSTVRCVLQRFKDLLYTRTKFGPKYFFRESESQNEVLLQLKSLPEVCHKYAKDLYLMQNTSKGKILFQNGVYEGGVDDIFKKADYLQDKELYNKPNWGRIFCDSETLFLARINEDFLEDHEITTNDRSDMLRYANIFIYNMHGKEVGDCLLEIIACALMCVPYKGSTVLSGASDAGKSVFVSMLLAVLDEYAAPLDASVFNYVKDDKREGSLRNSFVPKNWHRRILLASEKGEGLKSAEQFKQLASGNEDQVNARDLYDRARNYSIHFHMIFACNTMFKFHVESGEELDESVIGRITIVPFNKKFRDVVTNPQNELLKDATVSVLKDNLRFRQLFRRLLLDRYIQYMKRGDGKRRLDIPAVIETASSEAVGEKKSDRDYLNQFFYTFTWSGDLCDKKNFLSCDMLKSYCTRNNIGFTVFARELRHWIESKNFKHIFPEIRRPVNGKKTTGWCGFVLHKTQMDYSKLDKIDVLEAHENAIMNAMKKNNLGGLWTLASVLPVDSCEEEQANKRQRIEITGSYSANF